MPNVSSPSSDAVMTKGKKEKYDAIERVKDEYFEKLKTELGEAFDQVESLYSEAYHEVEKRYSGRSLLRIKSGLMEEDTMK